MTSADFASNRDNFCYRHPGRQSFVLCQRCLRTICGECQTQGPVGVICPDCVKAQRKAESPAQRRARRARGGGGLAAMFTGRPQTVTTAIVAITSFISLLQMIPGVGPQITRALLFYAPALYPVPGEAWRLFTALLVHGGILHLALNMLALYVLGRSLEPLLGMWRYLALYVLSGVGGSVAVALISPGTPVVGASGAIFGLFGAILVIGRQLGQNITGILVILGLNLVVGFIPGMGIAWQAHIGGAVVGAAVAFIYAKTRLAKQRRMQIVLLIGVALALAAILIFVVPAIY